MKRFISRRHSIYLQMLALLLFATVVSIALFLLMDSASEYLVDYYIENTDYAKSRNAEAIGKFQDYITKEDLGSRDLAQINQWVQEQKLFSVSIYKDGIQVFDSDYPEHEIWDDEIGFVNYDWRSLDTIVFSDGSAEIELSGAYRYQISNTIRIIEVGLAVGGFLSIVLLGIRRKMIYIKLLSQEVEVLEAGCLDYPISVKGKDEISMLAKGLESMRRSFLESRKKEDEMIQENHRVITEMSHDLRTPITAVLLYAEILKNRKYRDEMQRQTYIEKIWQKILQVKYRTDRLLEYSMKKEDQDQMILKTGTFSEAFFELLSEAYGYLEQKGYQMNVNVQWPDCRIRFHADYATRIIDNITSNIVKYASRHEPVVIEVELKPEWICLLFRNRLETPDLPVESNGIGIQSIRNMIREMGGECDVSCSEYSFQIMICFPVVHDS